MLNPAFSDQSFGAQMTAVRTEAPQAFVLTANSAIPLADSIRGYYQALDEEVPALQYVHARSRQALAHFQPADTYMPGDIEIAKRTLDEETARLAPLVEGMQHVCVVEQFVWSGRTLRFAAQILQQAGVERVSTMQGSWYQDVTPGQIDLEQLTSPYRQDMYRIGQLAARQLTPA